MISINAQHIVKKEKQFLKVVESVDLNPSETVFFVVDVWNKHWCEYVNQHSLDLAKKIDTSLKVVRDKGIQIIHMPADCMNAYKEYPQRLALKNISILKKKRSWYKGKGHNILLHGGFFPVQMSRKGGCPCEPVCKNELVWTKQHSEIKIEASDLISDHPIEVHNFLLQNKIKNIIYAGVHANVCLLKRPLGIRKMKSEGYNCYLCSDLTDIMYDPKMPPKTTHANALQIVLDYIEQRLCPTINSTEISLNQSL